VILILKLEGLSAANAVLNTIVAGLISKSPISNKKIAILNAIVAASNPKFFVLSRKVAVWNLNDRRSSPTLLLGITLIPPM